MFFGMRCNVIFVEYRGFGQSTGSPSEKALQQDAKTVISYVRSLGEFNNDRIYVMGRSLGGAVAIHVAVALEQEGAPLAGVIAENTFTSIPAMVPYVMPLLSAIPDALITNKVCCMHNHCFVLW
jgi:abhydrolase domain-containing protein 13